MNTGYEELISCVARRNPLSRFAEEAYRLLGNPLMITDNTFYVLAYYPLELPDDYVWKEIITLRYSPKEFVEQTDIGGYWKRIRETPYPLFVDEKAFSGMRRRAVASVFVGSSVEGYITVLEDRSEITEDSLNSIRVIGELLSIYLREENLRADSFGQMKNEFTSSLLTRRMLQKEMIETRASYLQIRFYNYHCVIGAGSLKQGDPGASFDELRHLFLNSFPTCVYSRMDNIAYYILSFPAYGKYENLFLDKLEDYLEHENMHCIVSTVVRDILAIPDCYEQVRRMEQYLADTGIRNTPRVISYAYDCVYPLARRMYEDPVYSPLNELIRSDEENGTDYVNTLQAFFACNQNVTECGRMLSLHRNSVNYRLDRIRELLPVDFDDHRIRLLLQLSIMKKYTGL